MARDFLKRLGKETANPGSAFRGAPFWAWNGPLDPDELRRQIRTMHRMGLGGFFMHSRVGLATAYLSDEWFACVGACVDEAKKLGMRAWLYDEDRWPSGAAGGLVTRKKKYRMRSLVMERAEARSFRWTPDIVAAFAGSVDGPAVRAARRLPRGRKPAAGPGETLLVFRVKIADEDPWYNDATYLDTMSHEAVREFIRVTHEAYRRRFRREFGRSIPGVFTDEPNHGSRFHGDWAATGSVAAPWTDRLPAVFRKRYGYDIADRLPAIFLDSDDPAGLRARYDYHECVTFLFVDAFSRQIGEWCGKNDLLFTGHALAEDTLSEQTSVVGDCMRFYEHMQTPGMDLLTERWRLYATAKQVSSAARQFGRKWRLTETYGCTGWDFSFAGHKALGDWQAALGVNLRCQHLSWYTMLGEAKRDYPAAIFYQSPWWELYPVVEDHFARVNAAMTRGAEVRDLLVVHPVESMWLLCRAGWGKDPAVAALDADFGAATDTLLAAHIDFDYGCEDLMARHAKVRTSGGRAVLSVGRASYRAVLVPHCLTLRTTTLKLIERFRAAGGTVVFAGEPPALADALPSPAPAAAAARCERVPTVAAALPLLEADCRRVSIAGPDGAEVPTVLHLLREDGDAFYLFVCNTGADFRPEAGPRSGTGRSVYRDAMVRDRTASFDDVRIRLRAEAAGAPVELDTATGALSGARTEAGAVVTSLPALGSRLFVFPKNAGAAALPVPTALREVARTAVNPGRWAVRLSEPNVLVLDRPAARIGGGAPAAPDEVLRVDRAVRAALKVRARGGHMVQPWARPPARAKSVRVALSYSFSVEAAPRGEIRLAVERPDLFSIRVNGVGLSADAESGWWVDRSLRTIPVDPALLRAGTNEVSLECDYREDHPGLEIVYLLGPFGTVLRGGIPTIVEPPGSLSLGDWTAQGLTFYSGSATYETEIVPQAGPGERTVVRTAGYRGTAVRVFVDGRPAGVAAWAPNEVDITGFVESGRPAVLGVEVVGHRRNSHGPFHHAQKWPVWTGPGEYVATGELWFDGYQLVPCGLTEPPEIVVRTAV